MLIDMDKNRICISRISLSLWDHLTQLSVMAKLDTSLQFALVIHPVLPLVTAALVIFFSKILFIYF